MVAAAALGVARARIANHVTDCPVLTPAVLAGKWAVRVTLERFVVPTVRVVHAAVGHQRAERRIFLAAVEADERTVLIALKQGVLAVPLRMKGA